MIFSAIYFFIVASLSFLLSLPAFLFVIKNNKQGYSLKSDIWLYMLSLSFVVVSAVYFLVPDFKDNIIDLNYLHIVVPFALATLLYIAFLFEINWLFYLSMFLSSAIMTGMIPSEVLIFEGALPLYFDRLIVFIIILSVTFFSKILNGMSAIFGIFVLTGLLGVSLISLFNGVPLLFGYVAAALLGVWFCYLRYNWYPSEVVLNDGACSSAGFLLSSLFLYSSYELAGSSILVLLAYLGAEAMWVIVRRYILRLKEPELYGNTAYFSSYVRDISVDAILVAVSKIAVINLIFACFQIYAPNVFSIPMFALVVNLWLLNMLYRASEENLSFKETNEVFLNEVKDGIKTISDSLKKGK